MAKLVFGMSQSLDGYVDHMKLGPPVPLAFRHFVEHVRGLTGCIYGRGLYEIMRYWDEDLPDWDAEDRDFAAAWRSQPKWVVSRSLKSVGPNATLVAGDIEAVIRGLKAELGGEIAKSASVPDGMTLRARCYFKTDLWRLADALCNQGYGGARCGASNADANACQCSALR